MLSLIYSCINGWVNNGEAGDLIRHRAHYDVIVMRFNIKTTLPPREIHIKEGKCHRQGLTSRWDWYPLQWRHNERERVSNHRLDCLLNRFPGADQRKPQSSASPTFVSGIHRWPMDSPHAQRGGNAGNVSIWWRHHAMSSTLAGWVTYISRIILGMGSASHWLSPYPEWFQIYAPVVCVIIHSNNGLSPPDRRQTFILTCVGLFLCTWTPRDKRQWNFDRNYKPFH